MSDDERTTVALDFNSKENLKSIGEMGESYQTVINKAVNFYKEFNNEREFRNWFEENYGLFGFEKILASNFSSFPDFILLKKGREIRVELETLSGNFIYHKHDPTKVDMVICLVKNKELSVPVIELTSFKFIKKFYSYKMVPVSQEVKDELDNRKVCPTETYEHLLRIILKMPDGD